MLIIFAFTFQWERYQMFLLPWMWSMISWPWNLHHWTWGNVSIYNHPYMKKLSHKINTSIIHFFLQTLGPLIVHTSTSTSKPSIALFVFVYSKKEKKGNASSLCFSCMLMPQVIPLLSVDSLSFLHVITMFCGTDTYLWNIRRISSTFCMLWSRRPHEVHRCITWLAMGQILSLLKRVMMRTLFGFLIILI